MKPMECSHNRLTTVGDRVFCCACGEELPLSFLTQDGQKKEDTAKSTVVKKTAKAAEKASRKKGE